MTERLYLPTLAELIDRLSIVQLKELKIPEHRAEYTEEIKLIMHDIDMICNQQKLDMTAKTIRDILLIAIFNLSIWQNEGNFRKGIKEGNDLELTHGLNSLRNQAKNRIQEVIGGRRDYKLDNVQAFPQWIPSDY